jgi:mannose-6-phosphate isomerase-like protein (cupin superfamily)
MKAFLLGLCVSVAAGGAALDAQQKRAPATATFAILVTDTDGTQVPSVLVTVEGPARRTVRTEGGRIALEGLPVGEYRLRFEKDGFLTLERELTARTGKPIEVKVTMNPVPEPPPPPAPSRPERPAVKATPAALDLLDVIDKEFVGRGAGKTTLLACGGDGSARLIQVNDPVADHTHGDGDEFIYVIAGEGAANIAGAAHRLRAGTLLFVPRGVTHRFSQLGRNPLIVLSVTAGAGCS